MNNVPTLKKMNLPSLDVSYGAFDIIGNTVGRFFDYKRDTAMIEYETEKLVSQTKVVLKKIDTELQLSFDKNEKDFQKEMMRLKSIAKELKKGRIEKKKIVKAMIECKDVGLMREYRQLLADEHDAVLKKLNLMSGFQPDTKLLQGV